MWCETPCPTRGNPWQQPAPSPPPPPPLALTPTLDLSAAQTAALRSLGWLPCTG